MSDAGLPELPPGSFDKQDPGNDLAFYAPARLVTHIDDLALAALTNFYRRLLPADGDILDLMSSWVSHLPDDVRFADVVGHGMNAEELAANPRLTERFVRDLNREPALPLVDGRFDAALCCAGVQYLQRPVEVFAEVRRVLRPGGVFAVSYSNRCFPTKAVAIWRALDAGGHARLIGLYAERAGFGQVMAEVLRDGSDGDPMVVVTARA